MYINNLIQYIWSIKFLGSKIRGEGIIYSILILNLVDIGKWVFNNPPLGESLGVKLRLKLQESV